MMGSLRISTNRLTSLAINRFNIKRVPILRRNFTAYDAEGKTMGTILNKKNTQMFCVDSVHTFGFILSNRMKIVGPVIMFPHTLISWNINSAADINEESLSIFSVLDPKPEVVIIGFGLKDQYTRDVQFNIFNACKKLKLNYEAMATEDAVATFNFLSLDHRYVAGAFVPPERVTFYGMDKTIEELEEERQTVDKTELLQPTPEQFRKIKAIKSSNDMSKEEEMK